MPRAQSGYARIAQAEEEEEERPYSDNEDPFHDAHSSSLGNHSNQAWRKDGMHMSNGTHTPRNSKRRRANSGVDIGAINARLERWAEEIKERFKIHRYKGRNIELEQLEIYSSVFQAPDGVRPATKHTLETAYDDTTNRMSKLEFDDIVESVRTAIELGVHPKLIAQGSSGSYFARNSSSKVVGVFKPKDEEPYASKNPKWTKWVHRNLFPFAFGRACLIPNLSYVSEAAAYILDVQLRTNLVPYTDVVSLSSKSFFYDYFDRRAYWQKSKPLPEKPGSFQIFLKGFRGATEFFKDHPWPDQVATSSSYYFRDAAPKKRKPKRWTDDCGRGGAGSNSPQTGAYNDVVNDEDEDGDETEAGDFWSDSLQQSFREQLEKLVILDYIMRNTDRGTDNWMIRIDTETQKAEIVVKPPPSPQDATDDSSNTYSRPKNMSAKTNATPATPHLGAIDNSLSWPWKHPDAWRSYPFGWLFLPVSLIGRPFSERTRNHFLPLLTSKEWWIDTQTKLRKCFELDADFKEKMFARQIAVMKGQAWNVVEALKTPDHGPLELTRRARVCVWDDIVEVPVAVPLTRPSAEMRRKTRTNSNQMQRRSFVEDEMDISTALGKTPSTDRLTAAGQASSQDMQSNPFNHARHDSSSNAQSQRQSTDVAGQEALSGVDGDERSPSTPRAKAQRVSLDLSRTNWQPPNSSRPRPHSFHAKRSESYHGNHNRPGRDDEDDDGDLGYAAANDQDGSKRKVIVERLETIKTKPPFFTWC